MAHAKLSPSASSRWMVCPGSVHLEPDSTSGESSEYAARGTAMHEVSERCLINGIDPQSQLGSLVNGFVINRDMVAVVDTYVSYVRSLSGHKFYEQSVSLEEVIPDCYGTADCVVIDGQNMHVIDLKTGGGVRVDAKANTQLMCYALASYIAFSPAYDIETITLTIVQPPLESIDSWTVTVKDLEAFAEALKRSYEQIQSQPTLYVPTEKGCKWCPAKTNCPEMSKLANEAAATDFADLAATTIDEWMPKLPLLKSFIDAVESKAKETLLNGGEVKGYKVVEGRRMREWADEQEVEAYLKQQGYDKIYSEPKLLSPAQMEKALKGEAIDLTDFIKSKAGTPTIAPVDDKRSSVDKTQSAKHDFGAVS